MLHPDEMRRQARDPNFELAREMQDAAKNDNTVYVRWHDGYLETFEATGVRFGSDLLWMRLVNGENRHIPLRSVRWFGLEKESHARSLDD